MSLLGAIDTYAEMHSSMCPWLVEGSSERGMAWGVVCSGLGDVYKLKRMGRKFLANFATSAVSASARKEDKTSLFVSIMLL